MQILVLVVKYLGETPKDLIGHGSYGIVNVIGLVDPKAVTIRIWSKGNAVNIRQLFRQRSATIANARVCSRGQSDSVPI